MTPLSALTNPPRFSRTRARAGIFSRSLRIIFLGLGILIMAAGIPLSFLPLHLGLPIMVIGLMIVLRNSIGARRQFIRYQRRHPNWVFPLRRLMRKRPQIVHVFYHAFLRTERLIVRTIFRQRTFIGRVRRSVFRMFRKRGSATA